MNERIEMKRYIEDRLARGLDTPELDGKEVLALLDEIETGDKIIIERNRLLDAIPACPVHGQCVPHAIEWVEKAMLMMRELKAENEALRKGMAGDYDLDAWLEFATGKIQKDADRLRWLRANEFDIGSFHDIQEFNAKAWFEHFTDESIDEAIAIEEDFAKENGQ